MLATALIVFREVLEAALIISIVMVASKGVLHRNLWVGGGVGGGLAGAALVAVFAGAISSALSGMGLEIFNASVLLVAVAMLGWHNIWMARHGREMAKHADEVSHAVHDGKRPTYALAAIAGVAVLREGAETVLFLYGIAASGKDPLWMMAAGGALGVVAGCAVGALLYFGLLRIPVSKLFKVTGWMVLLLAAGLAAQGAGFLVQADLLPSLGAAVWDTSAILTETSIFGKILHTLIGYISRPAGIQVLFYVLTLVIIGTLMKILGHKVKPVAMVVACAGITLVFCGVTPAHADFQVRSPIVEYHELEIEYNGARTFDSDPALDNARSHTISIGYGFLSFWKAELEGELEGEPGEDVEYVATTFENTFQLTDQGKYWADLGLFLEYSHARHDGEPDVIEFGPLVQKEVPGLVERGSLHTLNLFLEKTVGENHDNSTVFSYAWQSRLRLNQYFEPGIEVYGEVEDIAHAGKLSQQGHRAGPMFAGAYDLPTQGKIKYEAGYLLPLTSATEDGTLRWKLEYELPF
jgi:high-affinity iron transporter